MTKISSRYTGFYKRLGPLLLCVLFVPFSVFFFSSHRAPALLLLSIAMPLLSVGAAYYFIRRLIFDLMDEVYDVGDALLLHSHGEEERISLADIMNVNVSYLTNPVRVTLALRRPCRFGQDVSFALARPFSFNPLAKSAIITDLILRIDQLRHPSPGS